MDQAIRAVGNPVVVGIDPRLGNLPPGWIERYPTTRAGRALAVAEFSRHVIEAVRGRVPAVKFQAAFYEQFGPEGMSALESSARHAHDAGLLVILDGKRNDIGSTAEAYAQAYLDTEPDTSDATSVWCADALTINPYLGTDGIAPFVKSASRNDRGLFVLVRTSNPSAREFQDLVADGKPVYRHVAEKLAGWASSERGQGGYSLVGAVVGATYPEELAELRAALPGVIFLVPGYGAQGGTAASIASAFDEGGLGAVVNNSRGITFAYERREFRDRFGPSDWPRAIEEAVTEMVADLAANTPAGRLRTPGR
jgi:orotidine-5'-phosphate decarboxylase